MRSFALLRKTDGAHLHFYYMRKSDKFPEKYKKANVIVTLSIVRISYSKSCLLPMRFFTSLRFVQNDKWGLLWHPDKLLFRDFNKKN